MLPDLAHRHAVESSALAVAAAAAIPVAAVVVAVLVAVSDAAVAHGAVVVVVVAAVAATTSAVAVVVEATVDGQLARPLLLEALRFDSGYEYIQPVLSKTEQPAKCSQHFSDPANSLEQLEEHHATEAHNHWPSNYH